jgi:phosphoserine phosphatase RsbU/P
LASESIPILIAGAAGETRLRLPAMLEALGYQAAVAETGREALALAASMPFTLVLVGFDLARAGVVAQFSEDVLLQDIPIILLVQNENLPESEPFILAGAHDYLLTPTTPALLNMRIQSVLERKALRKREQGQVEREMLLKLEHDIHIGRQIQLSFLPASLPQPEGWEIAARFQPAREVAGDFYDSFYIWNRRRVGFIIADVSDKGVPAALFMAIFRTLLRAGSLYNMSISSGDSFDAVMSPVKEQKDWTSAESGQKPRKLPTIGISQLGSVPSTNAYMSLTHGIDSYFVTLFFGILDPRTGDVLYVNGGHNPPVIIRTDGTLQLLKPTGPAVGVLPEAKYRYAHTKLNPGDVLYAYTDGVTEARAPDGSFFTEARLLELLKTPHPSAASLLDVVHEELTAFIAAADQFDDITMMAIRRAPEVEA